MKLTPLDRLLTPLLVVQCISAARVVRRFLAARGSRPIPSSRAEPGERISVLVPVLNEYTRLTGCLNGLSEQGDEVAEVLVVDGGSTDGTPWLVARYTAQDQRIRLIDAGPAPPDWNGKAWGLEIGRRAARATPWLLLIDADVRPAPLLARSLLAQARRAGLQVLSVATEQVVAGGALGALHPALLTSLIYRYGPPGRVYRQLRSVQANGQCFLIRAEVLAAIGGMEVARDSACEDITLARVLARAGYPVGFFESGGLASAEMYATWRDAWINWPRSLPMRDRFVRWAAVLGLIEAGLVQASPALQAAALFFLRKRAPAPASWLVSAVLVAIRLGVLVGARRAYRQVSWTYWLSPLLDLPVTVRLWQSAFRGRHIWRGRPLVPERG